MEILIIILGYVPAILYYLVRGNNTMEWSWDTFLTVVLPILSIIASVFVSTRSGNGKVTSAKDGLSKEHEGLSKEHIALEGKMSNEHLELKKEHSELKAELKSVQNCIAGKLDIIDRIINNEIIRKDNLSPDQSKIDTAVNIIKAGWDNIIRENQELRQQVLHLQDENAALKCEVNRLKEDNSESDEWEQ